MISQFTWSSFRAASDKVGTRVLVEEQKFGHDVNYGNTKIFIRSPATLFALEKVRFICISCLKSKSYTIGSQLTARYWIRVAVLTVQFVPHRKHTPSP
jgi:myosin heavy subunit